MNTLQRQIGRIQGYGYAAILFLLFSYSVLSLRAAMRLGQGLDLLSLRRLFVTVCGSLMLLGAIRLAELTERQPPAKRIQSISIWVAFSAIAMVGLRLLYVTFSPQGDTNELAEHIRWVLVWFGYFLAWIFGYLIYHQGANPIPAKPSAQDGLDLPCPAALASLAEQEGIWASRDREAVRIPYASIQWIEAEGNYVRIHTSDSSAYLRTSMSSLQERLDPEIFIRVHRSAICNKNSIVAVRRLSSGTLKAVLADGAQVPVGRAFGKFIFGLTRVGSHSARNQR